MKRERVKEKEKEEEEEEEKEEVKGREDDHIDITNSFDLKT